MVMFAIRRGQSDNRWCWFRYQAAVGQPKVMRAGRDIVYSPQTGKVGRVSRLLWGRPGGIWMFGCVGASWPVLVFVWLFRTRLAG